MSDAAFAGIGTAHLSSELDSDGPYTISGVALGAGDVTVGSSGIKKKWPAEELEDAAETLEGQPLVRDHENSTDGRVGTVTEAYYRSGVGVMYEAELAPHYEQLAQDIAAGIQEVSARAYHDPVDELEEDDDTGALRTTSVVFDNLSVVSQGAAPSNTAEIGGLDVSGAVAMAQGPAGDAVATLEQGSTRPDSPDSTDETEELDDETDDAEELAHRYDIGDLIEWDDERLGSVTGIFVEDGVHKYKARVLQKSENGVEPTDETATVIAHNARRGPHVPTSDLKVSDEDEYSEPEPDNVDTEEAESESDDNKDVSELKSVAGVSFEGKSDGKLNEDEIPNDDYEQHYLFPDEENKSDSSYPVVDADGNLRKGNVAAAHQLGARGGVSEDSLKEKLMALNKEWPEGERPIDSESDDSEENAESAPSKDDDAQNEQSTLAVAALTSDTTTNTNDTIMSDTIHYDDATEDDIEEMSEPVVIEQNDVESLRDKAAEADELSERLDNLNSSLDELADNQEKLEDVDEDRLDELREYDEAVVLTEDEHEELQGLVDDIGSVFAEELADYSPFEADELQERFTPLELRDKVDEHDEASVASELGESSEDPEPEGDSVDPEELEDADPEDAQAELTEEELRERVADHLEDGKMYRQAEKVREGEIGLDEMGIDAEAVLE